MLSLQVAGLQAEIDDLRMKCENLLMDAEKTRDGKGAEVDKVISKACILKFGFAFPESSELTSAPVIFSATNLFSFPLTQLLCFFSCIQQNGQSVKISATFSF